MMNAPFLARVTRLLSMSRYAPGASHARIGWLGVGLLAFLLLLVPGLVPGVGAAEAQAQSGTIQGVVTDAETGAPLTNAFVRVSTAEGLSVVTRIANRVGFWSADVPVGSYRVEVSSIGRESRTSDLVQVQAGQITRVDLTLATRAIALAGIDVQITGIVGVEDPRRSVAAVAAISREQLAARPVVTPVDHLRSLAQVDVIQQGVQSTNVVVRGFNNIFSGALHTLTDYRMAGVPSLRVNVMSFVPTTEEDLERMELVFGPAAALYGPNTANGVLHMMTRSPLRDQGSSASVLGGERGALGASVRTAGLVTENLGVKISAQFLQAEEWNFLDATEEAERQKFAANRDFWRADMMRSVGISQADADRRIDRIGARDNDISRWSVEARADWAVSDDATGIFTVGRSNAGSQIELTGLGAAQVQDWSYTFYQARFERDRLFAQLYLNASDAGTTYLLRNGAPIVDKSKLWVGQVRHGTEVGTRNTLLYGVDFAYTDPETEGTINGIYEDDDQTREVGAYLQNTTRLSPSVDLVLAGRVDTHSALPDPVFSPRAGLVWNPVEGQTFRASFNRAFSTPSSLNQFLDLGTAIPNATLARLGYSVRVQGTGTDGFRFRQTDDSYQMRSPFTPQGAGGPAQLLPAAGAAGFWAAAVQVVAAQSAAGGNPLPPQLVAFMQSLQPTPAQIGASFLNPVTGAMGSIGALDLPDVAPIRESLQSTFEVGYRGIIADRMALQADVWYSQRSQLVTPLTIQTPLVLMNGQDVGAYLVPQLVPILMQGGMGQAEAQALAVQIATGLASVPVGVISSGDVNANGAQLLSTYSNVDDDFNVYGVDLSGEFLLTGQWSIRGSLAFVNDDHFTTTRGQVVTLNAPKRKGSLAVSYRNTGLGITSELRGRVAAGHPASSGVYEGLACIQDPVPPGSLGCVDSSTLFDLNLSYNLPTFEGASVQLSVQNLLDESFQSFPGTPAVGRMALLRLRYAF
jgi:outer membrane receptor for ferrienterochelin and colicins